jgi:hypothetical protein
MSTRICWIVGFAAILAVSGARAEEYGVTSASDVERIASQAKPGDVLVMADGDWKDQIIHFKGKGAPRR